MTLQYHDAVMSDYDTIMSSYDTIYSEYRVITEILSMSGYNEL